MSKERGRKKSAAKANIAQGLAAIADLNL